MLFLQTQWLKRSKGGVHSHSGKQCSNPQLQSVLWQDTELQIGSAPDEQVSPQMVSATSVWTHVWTGDCDKCYKALWEVSTIEKHYINAIPFAITRWRQLRLQRGFLLTHAHLSLFKMVWDLNQWACSCKTPFVICCPAALSPSLSFFHSTNIYFLSVGQIDGSVLE